MEGHDKNEKHLLSKHSASGSLSVPKIAFGAGNNQRRPNNTSQNSNSQQQERLQRTKDKNGVIVEENTKEGETELGEEEKEYTTQNFIPDNITIADGVFFPSLDKVLMNKSGSPLSQYNFYAYLRQEWRGEENLNFWLDVVTHENLFESWREYQDFIKKSRERRSYERSQNENVIGNRDDGRGTRRKINEESGDTGIEGDDEDDDYDQEEIVDYDYNDDDSSSAEDTVAPSVAHSSVDSKNPVVKSSNNRSNRYGGALYDASGGVGGKNSHEITVISEDQDYKQPEIVKRVGEEDLAKSALNIYKKYGHMNILPEENRITMQDLIERQGRFNPVVFSSAKSYTYHIMNVIYFPKFIQSAIDMNLTHIHAMIALPLGIVTLTFGLALELYYIFMGVENRLLRLWGFLPIWLGWILLQTAATRFLPPLILFGVSEHKLFRFHKIKERSILSEHRKRALTFMAWDTLAAIITLGILFAIPPIALYDKS